MVDYVDRGRKVHLAVGSTGAPVGPSNPLPVSSGALRLWASSHAMTTAETSFSTGDNMFGLQEFDVSGFAQEGDVIFADHLSVNWIGSAPPANIAWRIYDSAPSGIVDGAASTWATADVGKLVRAATPAPVANLSGENSWGHLGLVMNAVCVVPATRKLYVALVTSAAVTAPTAAWISLRGRY